MLPIEYTPAGSALFSPVLEASEPAAFDVLEGDALIKKVVQELRVDTLNVTEDDVEQASEAYFDDP